MSLEGCSFRVNDDSDSNSGYKVLMLSIIFFHCDYLRSFYHPYVIYGYLDFARYVAIRIHF